MNKQLDVCAFIIVKYETGLLPAYKSYLKFKTDVPMGYNRQKIKMKKMLFTLAVFTVMAVGAMTLSAFTTLNKTTIAEENEYTLAASGSWKLFRESVPYCDGDKGICKGYGKVWVNTETYQVAFETPSCSKTDLSEYTGKDGYNMRFWHCSDNKYYYVNIYIPSAAFDY